MEAVVEKVTGVGGVFFKAKNVKALRQWYREHLGVPVDDSYVTVDKKVQESEYGRFGWPWTPKATASSCGSRQRSEGRRNSSRECPSPR